MQHPDMHESWAGGHPDEGLLHEWLDEQLPETEAAAMQAHIRTCAVCQARVAEARGLIAASHRILSALDEVPANVIPTNFATGTDVSDDTSNANVTNAVTSLDAARKTSRAPSTKKFSWQTAGKIAAVLLFAVALGKAGLFTSDAPVQASSREQKAESSVAALSAPVSPVASGNERTNTSNRAAATEVAADAVAAKAPAAEFKKSAPAQTADAPKLALRKQPASPEPAAALAAAPPPAMTERRALGTPSAPQGQAQAADVAAGTRGVAGGRARSDSIVLSPMTVSAPMANRSVDVSTSVASVAQVADSTADKARKASTELSGRVAGANAQRSAMPMAPRSAGFAAAVSRAPFDSLTLNRTVCAPACETNSLHVNSIGDVRVTVGEGNTQRVGTGTLSALERDSINALVVRTFPDPASRFGRTACEWRDKESLRLTIDFAIKVPARAENGCGKSNAELSALSARLIHVLDLIRPAIPE